MPLLADKTVLLSCLFCNNETDEEAEVTTLLSGVSVHTKTIASANADGLSAASVMPIRIFCRHSTSARPEAPEAGIVVDDTFIAPAQWDTQESAPAAPAWTLRPGDHITYAGAQLTVLAVHDNRGQRRNPHWYVEAH